MSDSVGSFIGSNLGLGSISSLFVSAKGPNQHRAIQKAVQAAIIAGLAYEARKVWGWVYNWTHAWFIGELFPIAFISIGDPSFLWIMEWIAQDPDAQSQIKHFVLSTSSARDAKRGSQNNLRAAAHPNRQVSVKGDLRPANATFISDNVIGKIVPTIYQQIRITFQGHHLWVTGRTDAYSRGRVTSDYMEIRTWFWNRHALKSFLSAAHERFHSKQDHELLVFHQSMGSWQTPVSRPVRPWSSVILPGTVKQDLLSDIQRFLSDKEIAWYAARGIPHRRGYLLYGVPGSGKSTLATALASALKLDIYIVNPSQQGMTDSRLCKLFRGCPARSIILIEDIDCAFSTVRGKAAAKALDEDSRSRPEMDSAVTLSGILNAIDGIASQEGCILIASTNFPEYLDSALRRPGRLDVQIPFYYAAPEQASALFKHFYPADEFNLSADEANKADPLLTPVERLEALAAGFAAALFPTLDGNAEDAPRPGDAAETGGAAEAEKTLKKRTEVSMAAIQGYLMGHKEDPVAAVEGAEAWIAGHQEQKALRRVTLAPAPPPAPKKKKKVVIVEKEVVTPTEVAIPVLVAVGQGDLAEGHVPGEEGLREDGQREDEQMKFGQMEEGQKEEGQREEGQRGIDE